MAVGRHGTCTLAMASSTAAAASTPTTRTAWSVPSAQCVGRCGLAINLPYRPKEKSVYGGGHPPFRDKIIIDTRRPTTTYQMGSAAHRVTDITFRPTERHSECGTHTSENRKKDQPLWLAFLLWVDGGFFFQSSCRQPYPVRLFLPFSVLCLYGLSYVEINKLRPRFSVR